MADTPAPGTAEKPTATVAPTKEKIQQWIRNLDADKLKAEEATQALAKSGRDCIEPLATAIEHGSPELVMRPVNVFKELYHAADPSTQRAAQRRWKSWQPPKTASLAAHAAAILKPEPQAPRAGRLGVART